MTFIDRLRFKWLFKVTSKSSILGWFKLKTIYRHLLDARSIPGSAAELGVYKGGTARFIAAVMKDRPVHLFDTFAGMPSKDEVDYHEVGDFADTNLRAVKRVLFGCWNVRYHVGMFPETTSALKPDERFAFVHLDGDQYSSTIEGLKYFYPRMNPGGVIVLDDYKWPHCPGVEQALEEFLADKPEKLFVEVEFQAILIKQ